MADIPKIRFRGFTDDWEQRKLEKVVDVCSGRDYKHLKEGDIPVYGTGGYMLSVNESLSDDEDAIRIGRKGTIDNPYILRAPFWTVDTLFYAIPREKYDLDFVFDIFQNVNWKAKDESTGVPSLSKTTINAVETLMPEYAEQKKIGDYFRSLDYFVILYQRKCEQIKKLKKFMLQKMFPQDGKAVPKIRFEGFSEDWKQRKVTELGEVYIGLVTTMTAHYTNEGALLIRNSDIKDGRFEFDTEPVYLDKEFAEQNKSRMHKVGDVITVHTGDVGTSAVITENEANSIGFATIITRPNQELVDSYYLSTFLNTEKHKAWAVQMSTGDGRTNYNLRDYTKLVVPIPKLEEQKKIAGYISNLNHLITLYQRKCDALKEIKKFMLHNMFPQK